MNEKQKPDDERGKTDLEPARRYRAKVAEQAGKARAAEEDPEIERVSDTLKDPARDQ